MTKGQSAVAGIMIITFFALGLLSGLLIQSQKHAKAERKFHACDLTVQGYLHLNNAVLGCDESLEALKRAVALSGCDLPGPEDDAWKLMNMPQEYETDAAEGGP